jgi:hypothetical protein
VDINVEVWIILRVQLSGGNQSTIPCSIYLLRKKLFSSSFIFASRGISFYSKVPKMKIASLKLLRCTDDNYIFHISTKIGD